MKPSLHRPFQGSRRTLIHLDDDPFQEDPGLVKLRKELASIDQVDQLEKWRISVLGKYEAFVSPEGLSKASDADQELQKLLIAFQPPIAAVENAINNGDIRVTKISDRGIKVVRDLQKMAHELTQTLSSFIPDSEDEEDRVGYSKYQLGAVLLRNDFQVFDTMMKTRNKLCKMMEDCLVITLRKCSLEDCLVSFEAYIQQVQSFCKALEEIDLYLVMEKIYDIFRNISDITCPKVTYHLSSKMISAEATTFQEVQTDEIPVNLQGLISPRRSSRSRRLSAIRMAKESLLLSSRSLGDKVSQPISPLNFPTQGTMKVSSPQKQVEQQKPTHKIRDIISSLPSTSKAARSSPNQVATKKLDSSRKKMEKQKSPRNIRDLISSLPSTSETEGRSQKSEDKIRPGLERGSFSFSSLPHDRSMPRTSLERGSMSFRGSIISDTAWITSSS